MEREKVTLSSLVPTTYTMILQLPDKDKYDMSMVRRLLVSSAPLMTKTKKEILAFFSNSELFESYGATELGLVTWLRPEDQYRTVRSCGKVAACTQIQLIGRDGNECAPGEVGELYAKGPSMFDGYYRQPEANEAAFLGNYVSVGDMAKVEGHKVLRVAATGYGTDNVSFADDKVTDVQCAARGIFYFDDSVRTLIEIGAGSSRTGDQFFDEQPLCGWRRVEPRPGKVNRGTVENRTDRSTPTRGNRGIGSRNPGQAKERLIFSTLYVRYR
jgi:acyl-CoA synthetase (AMP-forming)/AMP-acid ligase II